MDRFELIEDKHKRQCPETWDMQGFIADLMAKIAAGEIPKEQAVAQMFSRAKSNLSKVAELQRNQDCEPLH
ncbi:hypothetical protein [Ferrimonas marina]|uniref:Uncharacterized protein n=1 Tax=Ferrimonas marina TaxID=299255 RepID=A0A1M5TAP2_9GAMM|nr:hypothetical protein [Ferrimonas marina]SHH47784.1 hypothetical protein SAMN02745129_2062 [Ferrimonas marina]